MSKTPRVIEMANGSVDLVRQEKLEPQVETAPDREIVLSDNDAILNDTTKYLKSHETRVERVAGRPTMLDPGYKYRGIDYRVGGLLDVRWVRNDDVHLSKAQARHWVFPETISPRLRNQTNNELVLMVRLAEQSANQKKYLESEAQNYERKDFNNMEGLPAGFSEFSVSRPTKRTEG